MKRYFALLVFSVFVVTLAARGENCPTPPKKDSKELSQLKNLSGHWEGTSSEGPVAVDYRVTSGGSAVVETLFPGTPHEMVSVYHDEGGVLAMTHYCMLGNQPKLALTSSSPQHFSFSFAKHQSGIKEKTEPHMHSLDISFIDPNTLVERWAEFEGGKENHSTTFQLKRSGNA